MSNPEENGPMKEGFPPPQSIAVAEDQLPLPPADDDDDAFEEESDSQLKLSPLDDSKGNNSNNNKRVVSWKGQPTPTPTPPNAAPVKDMLEKAATALQRDTTTGNNKNICQDQKPPQPQPQPQATAMGQTVMQADESKQPPSTAAQVASPPVHKSETTKSEIAQGQQSGTQSPAPTQERQAAPQQPPQAPKSAPEPVKPAVIHEPPATLRQPLQESAAAHFQAKPTTQPIQSGPQPFQPASLVPPQAAAYYNNYQGQQKPAVGVQPQENEEQEGDVDDDREEVVLSEVGWGDYPPCLKTLVESYLDLYFKEGGLENDKLRTIDLVIHRLIAEHQPNFVLLENEKRIVYKATHMISLEKTILNPTEVMRAGRYFLKMVAKVRACFLHVREQKKRQQYEQRSQPAGLICDEQITPFVDPVTLYRRQQEARQQQAQMQFQQAQQNYYVQQAQHQQQKQQGQPPGIPQSQPYTQKPLVLPKIRKKKQQWQPPRIPQWQQYPQNPFGLPKRPPQAQPPVTAITLNIVPQQPTATVTRHATRTTATANGQVTRPKIVSAPKTPDRVVAIKREAEETPIIANTSKKPKTNKSRTAISGSTEGGQKVHGKKRRLKKTAKKRSKSKKKFPMPVVAVEDLTYDWTSLNLDGTAAWNRMFKQRMLDNPVAHPTVPQVTAMDTYLLAKGLKDSLQTILPPKDSPLHDALRYDNTRSAESMALDMAQQRRLRFASAPPQHTPANCPDDLRPLYPRLAVLYQEMVAQDCCDEPNSLLRRSYQYMTAAELRQHMILAEQDVANLAVKEERVLYNARQLGLLKNHSKDNEATVDKSNAMDVDESGKKPVFWRQDFESLLKNGGSETRYLMHHDRY